MLQCAELQIGAGESVIGPVYQHLVYQKFASRPGLLGAWQGLWAQISSPTCLLLS